MGMVLLVGDFDHLEKYESQLGRIIPYIMEKIKMIQTTNQGIVQDKNQELSNSGNV
jgi:hypothetical protein